jgi:hypothetical protein
MQNEGLKVTLMVMNYGIFPPFTIDTSSCASFSFSHTFPQEYKLFRILILFKPGGYIRIIICAERFLVSTCSKLEITIAELFRWTVPQIVSSLLQPSLEILILFNK